MFYTRKIKKKDEEEKIEYKIRCSNRKCHEQMFHFNDTGVIENLSNHRHHKGNSIDIISP